MSGIMAGGAWVEGIEERDEGVVMWGPGLELFRNVLAKYEFGRSVRSARKNNECLRCGMKIAKEEIEAMTEMEKEEYGITQLCVTCQDCESTYEMGTIATMRAATQLTVSREQYMDVVKAQRERKENARMMQMS